MVKGLSDPSPWSDTSPSILTRGPSSVRAQLGSNPQCLGVHEIQGVGGGEHPSLEDGLRDDPRLPIRDLRRDLAGRGDLLLGRIQEWLEDVELVVVPVAVAQIDEETAPRREDRLVGGVGDHGAEGAVSEGPVADSADRVRPTRQEPGRVGLGDARGMEPILPGEGGKRCQRQAEERGCEETTESARGFHCAGIYRKRDDVSPQTAAPSHSTQGSARPRRLRVVDRAHVDRAVTHLQEGHAVPDPDGAEAGRGGEKGPEVALDGGPQAGASSRPRRSGLR